MGKNADNVNYEELIKERDKLIEEVRALEREVMRDHRNDCKLGIPPVIPYIATLNQLGMLCFDMAEKYNGEQADS